MSYAPGHQCTYPGCRKVLVMDGNMKNRRDVCMARDAGYIEYSGLPGAIKTGSLHTPRACIQEVSESDEEAPDKLLATKGDQIVESILEKKGTRKTTYYKVHLGHITTVVGHLEKQRVWVMAYYLQAF